MEDLCASKLYVKFISVYKYVWKFQEFNSFWRKSYDIFCKKNTLNFWESLIGDRLKIFLCTLLCFFFEKKNIQETSRSVCFSLNKKPPAIAHSILFYMYSWRTSCNFGLLVSQNKDGHNNFLVEHGGMLPWLNLLVLYLL